MADVRLRGWLSLAEKMDVRLRVEPAILVTRLRMLG